MVNKATASLVLLMVSGLQCMAAAPAPPSAAKLAKILRRQSNASIEARFGSGGKDGWRYVRTPKVIRYEHSIGSLGQTIVSSYDFQTGEQRTLTTQGPANGMRGYRLGSIQKPPMGPLSMNPVADFVLFAPVGPSPTNSPLADAVEQGSVATKMEKIDGSPCWRVDVTGKISSLKVTVWLDPKIGCCPRRVDVIAPDSRSLSYFFRHYKQLKKGIWFPMKAVMRYAILPGQATGPATVTASGVIQTKTKEDLARKETEWRDDVQEVTSAGLAKSYKKEDLIVKFPKGVRVEDERKQQPAPERRGS